MLLLSSIVRLYGKLSALTDLPPGTPHYGPRVAYDVSGSEHRQLPGRRRVFKLLRDHRPGVVRGLDSTPDSAPDSKPESRPESVVEDRPAAGVAATETYEPPRYVLTQSEGSRKRKIATFTAERPQKQLLAHDGRKVAVVPPPPSAAPTAITEVPPASLATQRKRPGASTATCRPVGRGEDNSARAVSSSTGAVGEEQVAFRSLLDEAENGDTRDNQAPEAVQPRGAKHRFLPRATTRLKDRVKRNSGMSDDTYDDAMDVDAASDTEYVYDTYILDEAMDFDPQTAEPGTVGLLHIAEDQQPIWETYLDETDSEDERASDDEDSNAEDYYGADYPEDEVASDDEYGVGAYRYRRNASDEEEFGPEDPDFSDAEEEYGIPKFTRYPR